MMSLIYAYRVVKSTISNIIHKCAKMMWEELNQKLRYYPNDKRWESIAEEFEKPWNFPNCVDAIDGMYITIHVSIPNLL